MKKQSSRDITEETSSSSPDYLAPFSTRPSSVFCTTKREKQRNFPCTGTLGIFARDAIRKFMKKFKPAYEKIGTFTVISSEYAVFGVPVKTEEYEKKQSVKKLSRLRKNGGFSEKLRSGKVGNSGSSSSNSSSPIRSCKDSSAEEKQNAIQSAIAYCKNSMLT